MGYSTIKYAIEEGVARLTLNRPDKLNSFNLLMHQEVRDVLANLSKDSAVRVLVVTGEGRAFCAGQDLSERIVPPGGKPVDLGDSIEKNYKPLALALKQLKLPVVASVNGVAAGAGANLAFACDIVFAAKSAMFVQSFCKLGLVPDCGGTWILPKIAGTPRAMGLALLGEKLPAEKAAEWGLIWKCVDDSELDKVVEGVVQQLSIAPTQGLARIKQALYAGWSQSFESQLNLERDFQRELGFSSDYREGVTAFIEKRAPKFTGRSG